LIASEGVFKWYAFLHESLPLLDESGLEISHRVFLLEINSTALVYFCLHEALLLPIPILGSRINLFELLLYLFHHRVHRLCTQKWALFFGVTSYIGAILFWIVDS
jgi:hypothetical protein